MATSNFFACEGNIEAFANWNRNMQHPQYDHAVVLT